MRTVVVTRETPVGSRRLELMLRRPRFHLLPGVRPTVVIAGRGQPAQWGRGTWMVPADAPVEIGVFLFNRLWRFGAASQTVRPEHTRLVYRAPLLPRGAGRIELTAE